MATGIVVTVRVTSGNRRQCATVSSVSVGVRNRGLLRTKCLTRQVGPWNGSLLCLTPLQRLTSVDGLEDTSCSTDNSPSAAFTRSGEQAELKRARGVRDPAYQREILQNRKIVWHADKGIWVSQKAPGGFDTVIEAMMEV